MNKMLTFLTFLAFLMTSAVSAQTSIDLGFKVGGNKAKMSLDDDSTSIFNLIAAKLTGFTGSVEVNFDARFFEFALDC